MDKDPTPFAKNNYPRLRFYQFRLRSLFVLTLFVAVGLSGFLIMRKVQRRQWDATVPILKAGGKVKYEQTALGKLLGDRSFVTVYVVKFTHKSVRNVDLSRLQVLKQLECLRLDSTDVGDADLACIQGLNQLFELGLNNTNVGDAGLEHLKEMKGLYLLVLSNTKISDIGLKHLSVLPYLCKLDLGETSITDAGLVHLKELKQLSLLNLAYTDVGDAGLSHISDLTELYNLDLKGTRITDAGLMHLKELKKLLFLDLSETRVTGEGVKMLQRALPKCDIEHTKGRVERWRGGVGFGLPLFRGFPVCGVIAVCRAPFPPPAHRTGRAGFPHPALGQGS